MSDDASASSPVQNARAVRSAVGSSWLRRSGTVCLRIVLILAIVLMAAYLTRRHWLEGLLIDRIETWLADATGGEVSIEGIDGNWIDTVVVRGLRIRASEQFEVEAGRFEAAIRLTELVRSRWLEVVHGVRISAARIRVSIPRAADAPSSDDAGFLPDAAWDTLVRVAPAGVRVEIADCEVESELGSRRGRLTLTLDRLAERRRLDATFAGLSVFGHVERGRSASLDASLSDPGSLLRALGTDNPLEGGGAFVRITAVPNRIDVRIDAAGIEVEQGFVTAEARVELEPGARWRVPRLEVAVPGGFVSARRISFDDPRLAGADFADLTGEIVVRVEDARRFESLVPPAARAFVPRRGWISGSIDGRVLSVDDGRLNWRDDVVARITRGSIPIDDRAAPGSLVAEARADSPFAIDLPDIGTLRVSGTASVELTGTLAHLSANARLDLGPGAFGDTEWSAVNGRLSAGPSGRVEFDLVAAGVGDGRVPQLPALAIGAEGSFEAAARTASVRVDVREETPPDRPPLRVVGPVTMRDDLVEFTELRCTGALAARASGHVDFGEHTLLASLEDVRADLDQLGQVLDMHLPRGRATASATLDGPIQDPNGALRLRVELDDARELLMFDHDVLAAPSGDLALDLEVRRLGLECTVQKLAATVGDAIACEAAGPLPLGWDGNRLVIVQHATPFSARIQTRIDGRPAAHIEWIESSAVVDWTSASLRIAEFDVSAEVLNAATQRVSGFATFDQVAEAIVDGDYRSITVSGSLTGDTVDLSTLRPLTGLPLLEGSARFAAELGGPLPFLRSANVTVDRGRVKFSGPVPTIEDIDLAMAIGADGVRFERAEASLGSGRISLEGGAAFDGWDDVENARVDAALRAEDALVLRRTGLKLRADGEITLTGALSERILVDGRVLLTSGKFVRRMSVLPDHRSQGSNIDLGFTLPVIPDPFGSHIRYDVAIETVDPFEVMTWVVDAPIQADVRLRGTGAAPRLEGTLAASEGTVRLPAMSLSLTQGLLTFSDTRPGYPDLFAIARGTRFGVDVQAQVQGAIDALEIDLTSTPALPREDLTVLLSTGRLPDDLRERGLRSQATLVGTYLAQELLDLYFGSDATDRDETLVDRFNIESGREISRNGVETLTIEFDMREGFFLQAERDMYEDYNMGVLYRFKF